ncbi:DUF2000 domain-containing protein [Kineococcus glutinatus]|uniref:DUF2000 domain-containing protein n=1 Tax=Kineococcus glutinatus TaxID=1070872 RepID=A0ABP9H9Z9_9ACTN
MTAEPVTAPATAAPGPVVGFAPGEVLTDRPTREARLKWVLVVDETLPAGRVVNAAACIAAGTGASVAGLVAGGGPDASGTVHPGLPWTGCAVLAATPEQLAALRERAVADPDLHVVDMPAVAQAHRVYDDYLAELATTPPEAVAACAVSVVGPRNRVDRLVRRLALLP